jgi:hypothetical protein
MFGVCRIAFEETASGWRIQTMRSIKCLAVVLLMVPVLSGCAQSKWDVLGPAMEKIAEQGAEMVISHPSMAPHRAKICEATTVVAGVLENFDDSNATLDQLREITLAALANVELEEPLKTLLTNGIDIVMTEAVRFVQIYYDDLVKQDEARTALEIARAVARGFTKACNILPGGKLGRPADTFLFSK